jgi:hypothetical protein
MSDEWFDVAVINGEIYILHGQIVHVDLNDQTRTPSPVYVTLDFMQQDQIETLQAKHDRKMKALLRSMVPA